MIDTAELNASARRNELAMSTGLGLFALLLIGLLAFAVLDPETLVIWLVNVTGYAIGPIGTAQTVAVVVILAVHLLIWIRVFEIGRRVFQRIAAADPESAARYASRLASLIWIMLGWGIVSNMLLSVALSWGLPEGQRALQISIGTPEVFAVFAALIAGFMARAFALGAELWRDHREVI